MFRLASILTILSILSIRVHSELFYSILHSIHCPSLAYCSISSNTFCSSFCDSSYHTLHSILYIFILSAILLYPILNRIAFFYLLVSKKLCKNFSCLQYIASIQYFSITFCLSDIFLKQILNKILRQTDKQFFNDLK